LGPRKYQPSTIGVGLRRNGPYPSPFVKQVSIHYS
jgi:hypothetical protein